MTDLNTLKQMDRDTFFHPFTHVKDHASGATGGPRIIKSGKGIRITDVEGKSLIDAFAGLYCVNIGYGRTEVAEAIYEQAKELAYYHTYVGHSSEAIIKLSQKIIDLAPEGMSKVYYGMSGSDANETQVKLVWYYNNVLGRPNKKKIISRQRGYHGASIVSGSLTGLPVFHQAFDLPIQQVKHTVTPHYYWGAKDGMSERDFSKYCAQELENLILAEGPDTVAAFIGEPVLGTGGLVPPPEGYWDEIQAVLKKYDILLIADEVVCAFGRVGENFGCDKYNIKPDLITTAKGLTSAYAPLSAVIIGDKVWKVLEQGAEQMGPIGHGWTYSGHPIGAAAGLANLDIVIRENLAGNAKTVGAYLNEQMQAALGDHPIVGEVRGAGLLCALEFVADPAKKERFDAALKVGPRISAACLEQGMIARAMPHGDILGFAPPLVITKAEVDEIVAITKKAVDKVADELTREGALQAA